MAGQSMIMGDAFGKAYQYGKRKISAMTNEEFNALDAKALGEGLKEDYLTIMPSLKEAVVASREFQHIIIQELGTIVKSIPQEIMDLMRPDSIMPNVSSGQSKDVSTNLFIELIKFMIGTGAAGQKESFQLFQKAFAEHGGQTIFTETKDDKTSGPIGPQQPTLDPMYAAMHPHQLVKIYNNKATWNLIPQRDKTIILRKIQDLIKKPTLKEKQQKTQVSIEKLQPSEVKMIATLFNQVTYIIGWLKKTNGSSTYVTKAYKVIQQYNRYVQQHKRRNFTIDSTKTIKMQKIVLRYR